MSFSHFRFIFVSILVCVFGVSLTLRAAMSSPSYQIQWDTIGIGGSDASTSSSFKLFDTLGNTAPGNSDSATYQMRAGYRQGVHERYISMDLFSSQLAKDAVLRTGTTVEIASGASSFTVGTFVALVKDVGTSQATAIGKITAIDTGLVETITVDAWRNAGVDPFVIDGTNDKLYLLSSSSLSLPQLQTDKVSTGVIGFDITSGAPNGYTVSVMQDHGLQDGSDVINAVTDGSVTAGSEEYGMCVSDDTATDFTRCSVVSPDEPITSSFQSVAVATDTSVNDRNFLVLKASRSSSTPTGSYAQTLSFIIAPNY